MELRVMSGLPKQITDYQLECAWYWLSLIKDEGAMLELLKMSMDYNIHKYFINGERK